MFEIVLIIVSRLLLIYIGFRIYRMYFSWGMPEQPVVGPRGRTRPGAPKTQQGFIFFKKLGGEHAERAKFRKINGDFKSPWGW